MSTHTLAQIKLKASEFIQEYERQETEREFQKQRIKQNVMLEIMSNRNKSQSSSSIVKDNSAPGSRIKENNSNQRIQNNHSRAITTTDDRKLSEEKNANRTYSMKGDQNEDGEQMKGAEVTFKMPKGKDSYILVQGQSQNEEQYQQSEDHEEYQNSMGYEDNFNSTLKEPYPEKQMTFRIDQSPPIQEKPTERKFKLTEPQIEPDSPETHEFVEQSEYGREQIDSDEGRGVFLTMEEEESMEVGNEGQKNCAFDIVMDKSQPIDNIEELRKKKIEEMQRKRQQRMEEFRKNQQQKQQRKLDTSQGKIKSTQGYSRKSQTKISEDPEPDPVIRAPGRRKISEDRQIKANVSAQNIAQQSQYSLRPDVYEVNRSNYLNPPTKNRGQHSNRDFERTPKTIASENRNKSRPKNTIFRESPKRFDKSASKYSQDPKIEPKDRKNTFIKQSNKKLMINAINNVCLPGELNRADRQRLIKVIESDPSQFFVFLFKEYSRKVIKAIYTLDHTQTVLQKIYGEKAPHEISAQQVNTFYRFDSGSRQFKKMDGCKSFSFVVHAIDLR